MAFDNPVSVIRGRFERGALPRMPHVEVLSLPFWGKMDRQATRCIMHQAEGCGKCTRLGIRMIWTPMIVGHVDWAAVWGYV